MRTLVSSGTFEKLSSFACDARLPDATSGAFVRQTSLATASRLPHRMSLPGRLGRSATSAPVYGVATSAGDPTDVEDKRKVRVTAL